MEGDTFASRIEQKYLLTGPQWAEIRATLEKRMRVDRFGDTTVCNLYLDTPDDLLTRRSLEKPDFKQKVRLRSYGVPDENATVYLEIKKKLDGVVYKRRAACTLGQAARYLRSGEMPENGGQVLREIDALVRILGLTPRTYLAYDRRGYEMRDGGCFRLTVDRNIRSRREDLDLTEGDAGRLIMDPDARLLEVKSLGGLPLWLCRALGSLDVYPASFSKIGETYRQNQQMQRRYAACSPAFSLPLPAPAFPRALR